ncbi:MAG: glycosyltransferase family 2 protein [Actinomycetota bacterium]
MEKVTVALIIEGFGDDALATIHSILNHSDAQLLILINGKQEEIEIPRDSRIELVEIKQKLGWANAINQLISDIKTPYLVIMDPSTIFMGDAITPALHKIKEGFVAVGWRGGLVNVEDEWRSVEDKGEGEVDVLFSYFMLVDREFALTVGANPSAKYYRNADLELSLALREAGGKLYQLDLPLEQGRHHGYHDVNPAYREKHSKANYNRILRRFRGKSDILSPRR